MKEYLRFVFKHLWIFVLGAFAVVCVFLALIAMAHGFNWLISDENRTLIRRYLFPALGTIIFLIGSYGIGTLLYRKFFEEPQS